MMDFGEFVSHCGPEQLDEALYHLSQSYPGDTDCLVLFESQWCPDCVRATPEIKTVCVSEQTRLLIVNVGSREEYRNPENKLKFEPWNLKCIPTLCCLNSWRLDTAINSRLDKELECCKTKENVIELVEIFIQEKRLGMMSTMNQVTDDDEYSIPILPDNRDNKVNVEVIPPGQSNKSIYSSYLI